ncbi:chemotaxis protein CheW [Collimonas silvisoli]|uniref:chemotaxis protein CheW n=1 Tax=Collimonas silvisoli TaxID=2825884 RepID=UPI001B8B5D83|nr:chemotaxis protein CheW [Collimonas silvisoli]
MNELNQLVVFFLDGRRYALPLATVTRIIYAADVTPLPNAPAVVLGAIDLQGEVIPVLNIRRRFLLPERAIGVNDQFLIALTQRRTVALVVDETQGICEHEHAAILSTNLIAAGLEQFQGVIKLDDDLVLIYDLEKFLSLDEACMLDEAIDRSE